MAKYLSDLFRNTESSTRFRSPARGVGKAASAFFAPTLIYLTLIYIVGLQAARAEVGVPPGTGSQVEAQKIKVAVTIPPQVFFVNQVGAPYVEVEPLMPATADHETYEPSIAQIKRLKDVQIFFRIGHPLFTFESVWVKKLLSEAANPKLTVIDMFQPEDFLADDIHVWLSLSGGRTMARAVLRELVKVMPSRKEYFEERYAKVLVDIETLEAALKERLTLKKRSTIIVYHPSWGYLVREFGLTQSSVEVEGKEPSPTTVAKIVELARKDGIKTILADRHAPKQAVEQIAKDIDGEVVLLDPLQQDWFGVMYTAIKAIVRTVS